MVDISSQNNKINITVSSSGNTANTNVTPDYAKYYSEKSKEWAISNKIVDNTDYSSKYYANESKKQADISTAKATEVVESGNNAVSNIENARDNAIIDITNQESLSVDNVNTAGITQVANVNSAGTTQINLAKEQVTLATNQANIATEQATIATNKTNEVVTSGNEALNNIDTAKDNAITTITTQETTSKNNVIATGNEQVDRVIATGNNYDNLTHKNITNCLLEVPQNIKLELKDGVLTIKAGSKFIMPNGANVFTEGVTIRDNSVTYTWAPPRDMQCMMFLNKNGGVSGAYFRLVNTCLSGTTTPSITNYTWYDTANNIIKTHEGVQQSFPIAIITQGSDGVTKSIDQVFNGFGYIGNTVWVDKGVKGLVPNGRNADGSLRNIEYTQQWVTTEQLNNNLKFYIGVGSGITQSSRYVEQEEEPTTKNTLWYKPSENKMYRKSGSGVVTENSVFVGFEVTTGDKGITSLQPKQPFRAVDYNEALLKDTPHIVDTYVNGTSWYRVWSDGWCEQGGETGQVKASTKQEITLLKPFANANYYANSVMTSNGNAKVNRITNRTTTQFTIAKDILNSADPVTTNLWEAKGYIK